MRTRMLVILSPCILNARLQAVPKSGPHWGLPFSELLGRNDIDIFELPCPETEWVGLPRNPHGIDYYMALDGFTDYCRRRAEDAANNIRTIARDGTTICYCVGVEHSPTCAVSYIYSHHGMLKREGIFFGFLFEFLAEMGIEVQRIGINRSHIGKALNYLRYVIETADEREDR